MAYTKDSFFHVLKILRKILSLKDVKMERYFPEREVGELSSNSAPTKIPLGKVTIKRPSRYGLHNRVDSSFKRNVTSENIKQRGKFA